MKGALELLKPLLQGSAATTIGKVVIGTVKGDLHDIGKNLVASMLEGCGFEVINIGIDVSCDKFVERGQEKQGRYLVYECFADNNHDLYAGCHQRPGSSRYP